MRMVYIHCPNCESELELEGTFVSGGDAEKITCQDCGNTFPVDEALIDFETEDNKWIRNRGSDVWWTNDSETIGTLKFSFDREKVFHLFRDYPDNLTEEEQEKFAKNEAFWVKFFEDLN